NPPEATDASQPSSSPRRRGSITHVVDGAGDAASLDSRLRGNDEDGEISASPIVRVDDGVAEGGEVSMFYDPMIAKLITWAPTREAAIDAQIAALDAFEIEGPGTNIDFLSAL
ncbi:hypothetical protein ACTGVP_10960, partial [Streptococcus suis]